MPRSLALPRVILLSELVKSSIAARIFGLAIMLVAVMNALVTFLLFQERALDRTSRDFSQKYEPLDQALVDPNEAGLRRCNVGNTSTMVDGFVRRIRASLTPP